MHHHRQRAYAFAIAAVLLWSTVATAFKLSLRWLDPFQLLAVATVVSTVVLGVLLAARGQPRASLRMNRRALLTSLILGALNPLLYYLILFKAYERLPAQEAQALNYTWALTLALLSVPLLGQRLGARDVIGGIICYSGVLVIATRGTPLSLQFQDPTGVALALSSTVVWSLYWILGTRDRREPIAALFVSFLIATPLVLIACALASDFSGLQAKGVLAAAYVGLFEMGLAFVLWLSALRSAPSAASISNLIFLSPFLSLVAIYFVLGEPILPSTFAGLGLIVTGLLAQKLRRVAPPAGRSASDPAQTP